MNDSLFVLIFSWRSTHYNTKLSSQLFILLSQQLFTRLQVVLLLAGVRGLLNLGDKTPMKW